MRRSTVSAGIPSGALCLAVLLSSCGSPGSGGAAGEGSTTDAEPAATASPPAPTGSSGTHAPPSSSESAPATATAGEWSTYTTADRSLSFDHPAGWTVSDVPGAPPAGVSVVVGDAGGRQLAALTTNLVTGAVCPAEMPYLLLDSEALPELAQGAATPRFTFEGRTDPSETDPMLQSTLAYGITSAPEPTGDGACPISLFFTWPPSGAAFGGTYDPFEIYPGKPQHVDTPHAYMETEEYQDIRRMITSLRPAG